MAIEWATVGVSAGVAALAWVATNFVGKPITGIQSTRLKAIEAVEQHSYIPVAFTADGEERTRQAKAALRLQAASLRSFARSSNWAVRLYCRAARYDLERAALAILGLAAMAGDPRYHDTTRNNNVGLFYWSVASDRHLTAEQRAELVSLWQNRSQGLNLE